MKLPTYFGQLKKPDTKAFKRAPIIIRRVHGHSMVPVLPPGTTVWGWGWFRSLKPGQVIVFRHDGHEKIKRIDHIADDKLFVVGDHPETSTDSRHFGLIDPSDVIAKIFWPHSPKDRIEGY